MSSHHGEGGVAGISLQAQVSRPPTGSIPQRDQFSGNTSSQMARDSDARFDDAVFTVDAVFTWAVLCRAAVFTGPGSPAGPGSARPR